MNEQSDTRSPLWRLIAEQSGVPPDRSLATPLYLVQANDRDWRAHLAEQVLAEPDANVVIVGFDRGTAKAVLGMLAHARWRRHGQTPSAAEVDVALASCGFGVFQRYALWPSSSQARLAIAVPGGRHALWLQRSGVLGGGGSRTWARALARSWLFSPLAGVLTPGMALLARRR